MAYTQNYIRLTDKFLIERNIDEVATFMTIDGHDLQDFVLELQSNFTTELELQVINIDASLEALNQDLTNFKGIENSHYSELSDDIKDLNNEVYRNRVFIDSNKEQLDILNEQTRLVGNYQLVQGPVPDEGEVTFKVDGRGANAGQHNIAMDENSLYMDVVRIKFNKIDAEGNTREFDNILVGDIIELSQYNEYTIFTRATFQVTSQKNLVDSNKVYAFEVEYISGAGDGNGIPYLKEENGLTVNDRLTRGEVYPSVDLQEMALTEDYETMLKNALPVGIIMPWISTKLPPGFQECNGSALTGDPQDNKYQAFRDLYGTSTPDMRGRALVGYGAYGCTTLNSKKGQTTSAPSTAMVMTSAGAHTHSVTIDVGGSHTHQYGNKDNDAGGTGSKVWGGIVGQNHHESSSAGSHTHTSTVTSAGGHTHTISGWDTYNRMYSYVARWIVKTHNV